MKKFGKFLLPPAFSIGTVVTCLLFELGLTFAPIDGYAALTIFFIFVFIWALLVLPFFCVKYTKIIVEEKYRFVFCIYNCILISLAPLFCVSIDLFKSIFAFVFLWVAFCTFVPLLLRLSSKKRGEDPTKSELPPKTAFLFRNKTKHIVAICFVSLYVVTLLTDNQVLAFFELTSFMYYTLPAISAVFPLVFLLTKNKEYILKDYMLSIALAGEAVSKVFSDCSSLDSFSIMLKIDPLYPATIILSCLITIMVIIMFVGTLFDFKYIKLLKIGSLSCVVLCGARFVLELVEMLFFMDGFFPSYLLAFLTRTLYFAGIYVLTTNERGFPKE